MKYSALLLCVMVMIYVTSSTSADVNPSVCIPKSGRCNTQRSQDCSTRYCRNGVCISFGDAGDDGAEENPCDRHTCPCGQICVLQQVQCYVPPCSSVANCVNANDSPCHA